MTTGTRDNLILIIAFAVFIASIPAILHVVRWTAELVKIIFD
jgi:hypothetical protein